MIQESRVTTNAVGFQECTHILRRKRQEGWWSHLALLERRCRCLGGYVVEKGDLHVLIILREERDSSTADTFTRVGCRAETVSHVSAKSVKPAGSRSRKKQRDSQCKKPGRGRGSTLSEIMLVLINPSMTLRSSRRVITSAQPAWSLNPCRSMRHGYVPEHTPDPIWLSTRSESAIRMQGGAHLQEQRLISVAMYFFRGRHLTTHEPDSVVQLISNW